VTIGTDVVVRKVAPRGIVLGRSMSGESGLKDLIVRVRGEAAYVLLAQGPKVKEAAKEYVASVRPSGLPVAYPVIRIAMFRALGNLAVEDKEAAALLRELLAREPHRTWAALEPLLN
jgi:hypothetical protein